MTPTVAGLARLAGPTDADLLARFAATRDDAAFAELVRRHGPAVLAVCRRLTGHAQDAEDAFQAAFLVLARKADRVRPGEPVAGWLYGVAVRAARNAAARTWRRREVLVEAVPDVPARAAEPFDADAAAAVLDEVERLPDFLRSAVILCELEGRPRAAAARELGVAAGTLSSRLAAARKRLAARLAARGFAPAALAALAPAAVPPRLAAALAATPVPPAVASLANGVLRAMTLKPLRAAGLAVALVAAAVAAGFAGPPAAADPAPAPPPAAPQAVAAAGGGQLLLWCGGNPVLLRPDGTEVRKLPGTGFEDAHGSARLHPDGKRFAYSSEEQPRPKVGDTRVETYVRDLTAPGLGKAVGVENAAAVAWGDGGDRLYGGYNAPGCDTAWVSDADGGDVAEFSFPVGRLLLDRSPDGRHLLALKVNRDVDGPPVSEVHLLRADRTTVAVVSPARYQVAAARFAPDGRSILLGVDPPAAAADPGRPVILRVSMKDLSESTVTRLPKGTTLESVCGSPDGARVAYTWYAAQPEGVPASEYVYGLTVCDLRGGNAATVYTRKGTALGSVDWR